MATMLDDLLGKRGISTVASPAATGSGAVTGAVAAPPPPPAPPPAVPSVAPDSAVGKAIGMNSAITDAANAQMKSDPMLSGAIDSLVKLRGYIDQAGAEMDRRSAEMATIQAQPDPERIAVPRMKPLPPIPTLEDVAKERGVSTEDFNNPMRVFGQMMPLLVAFGALATQRPGINALNAATAAMTAVKQGDKDAYDKAHKEWLENTKLAADTNQQMLSEYNLALADRNTTMAEKQAKIAQIAATHNDPLAKAALEKGYIEQFIQLQRMREGITTPLITLTELTTREAQGKAELQLRRDAAAAELYFKTNPPRTSQDEQKAFLAGKVMRGEPLTAAETAAIQLLKDFAEKNPLGGSWPPAGAEGAAPAPTAAAPAKPAAAPAPASPATKPPPVSMLQEGKNTSFKNGQGIWTLRGGKAVYVGPN